VLDEDGMTSFRLDRSIKIDGLTQGLDAFAKELMRGWELVK
jgi:hypothetical protein